MKTDELDGWHPGLYTEHLTAGEILATLPGDGPEVIPWQVRILENPSSPLCMPGGSTLARHDPLHPILAHGTSKEGECFLVGYSMGAASATRWYHLLLFRLWMRFINPPQFRMSSKQVAVFDRGVRLAQESGLRDIHLIPLEEMTHCTVGELRHLLGISTERLAQEPHTKGTK